MKKPNITKGKWAFIEVNGDYNEIVGENGCVCQNLFRFDDVKAITAVPDLIDALIDIIKVHRNVYGLDGAWDVELEKAEKALKKSGVEL